MQETTLRLNVIESFSELLDALAALSEGILYTDSKFPAWFQADLLFEKYNPPSQPYRTQIVAFIQQLQYLDNQNPKNILIGPGLVAASEPVIALAEAVNTAKSKFKAAMINLKKHKLPVKHPDFETAFEDLLNTPHSRETRASHTLRKLGLARLHLKQCYRLIPIFKQKPLKVRWTWAHTKAITRISQKEAEQKLLKLGDDFNIKAQLQKLFGLSAAENLAIVQELAPHLRANLLFTEAGIGPLGTKRLMIKGPMPIFYLAESVYDPLPDFKPPRIKTEKNPDRLKRSDTRLSEAPFLPAIRAYRYETET
ncbi:MAG: DNA replication terminus site-binding family protein [Gammaproteobacteria bacterium]